jgi:hypothetical protein
MTKTRIPRIRSGWIAVAAIGLLASACHKQPEPEPENEATNQAVEAPTPPPPAPTPTAPAPAPTPPKPKPVAVAPAPAIPADQQVIDDADATGMTAHVSHDASGTDNGN